MWANVAKLTGCDLLGRAHPKRIAVPMAFRDLAIMIRRRIFSIKIPISIQRSVNTIA